MERSDQLKMGGPGLPVTPPLAAERLAGRWPVSLKCEQAHELVTWMGTWVSNDESSTAPECFVCGLQGRSAYPKFPYIAGSSFVQASQGSGIDPAGPITAP